MTAFYPARIIGHRGAALVAPENTLSSLRAAAFSGARMVEVDAKLSADGGVILMHDDDLDRTTNGRGPVKHQSLEALLRLDAGAWFSETFRGERLATLEDAVALLAELRINLNMEVKPCAGREVETAERSLAVLRALWPQDQPPPVISSFAVPCMAVARDVAGDWPRAMLWEEIPADWRAQVAELTVQGIHTDHRTLSPDLAGEIKAAGLALACYTVNEPQRARELWSWGVDAVFTDDPAMMLRATA